MFARLPISGQQFVPLSPPELRVTITAVREQGGLVGTYKSEWQLSSPNPIRAEQPESGLIARGIGKKHQKHGHERNHQDISHHDLPFLHVWFALLGMRTNSNRCSFLTCLPAGECEDI